METIVAFGCSNTYGQGLVDCHVNNGPGPVASSFAWPSLLADMYQTKLDNQSIPGASNLEILTKVLNYQFKPNQMALIMWATTDRDYIFDEKPIQLGAWQSTDIVKHWLMTHPESDLVVRSWLYMQHSSLYLQSKQIKHYNFFSYTKGFYKFKPDFINVNIHDVGVNKDDYALDNLHMGPLSHNKVANSIKRVIDAN